VTKYYSQNGEDFLLCNLLEYKDRGFYVDVGAFDGVHLSNTYSFEQQGWPGICVEPNPRYFQLCKRSRPLALCLNFACVADEDVKTVEFYEEELGLLSGVYADREDDVRARYQGRGLAFEGFSTRTVPAATLNSVLSKNLPHGTEIDFISIDVEGTELEVLRGVDLSRFRPRVLLIEANSAEAEKCLGTHLMKFGYIQARRLIENVFFARDCSDVATIRTIPIDCRLERSIHPLGEEYTPQAYRESRLIRMEAEHRVSPVRQRITGRLRTLLSR
jgi:FkbM family methyltransferase